MKYLSNKNGFLGIDNKVNFKEKVVVVPFGLEKTVSYGGGTKNGPKEIIKAFNESSSAVMAFKGRMIDLPIVLSMEKRLRLVGIDPKNID